MGSLHCFQRRIVAALMKDDWLLERQCQAFAFEDPDLIRRVGEALATVDGVAIVVATPEDTGAGARPDPAQLEAEIRVEISITERPETRENRCGASATTIAEHIAVRLDQPAIRYQGRRSSVDRQTGAVTVVISFNTDLALRAEADNTNQNED